MEVKKSRKYLGQFIMTFNDSYTELEIHHVNEDMNEVIDAIKCICDFIGIEYTASTKYKTVHSTSAIISGNSDSLKKLFDYIQR